jgi:hypothetical protein
MINTVLQVMSDSAIVVSSLPHPVSMFLLAISLMVSVYLFFQQRTMNDEMERIKTYKEETRNKIVELEKQLEKKIEDVSRKVDSRVDKALKKN